ncbi:MAG TPA: YncE family protein [Gemmatimonadaceae bacterium]|nr:YncE family protein [Gemmatimonadaceae bacterium]
MHASLRFALVSALIGANSQSVGAQARPDTTLKAVQRPLEQLSIVARVALPASPDWIGIGFGSIWVVNYRPDRVTRIDTTTNAVVADIPIGRNGCLGVILEAERVWVPSCVEGVINEIDPAKNAIVRKIPVPITRGREGSFAFADGSFWVPDNKTDSTSSSVARIDARTGNVVATIATGKRSDVVVAGFGSIWVASSAEGVVARIDPATNRVVSRINVGPSPKFMAAGEGAVWVQNRGDGSVSRIDPATGREIARIQAHAPTQWGDIAVGAGAVWLAVNGMPVTRIDPRTNAVTHQFVGGDGADAIRFGAGALWVADHQHGDLWRIDAKAISPR